MSQRPQPDQHPNMSTWIIQLPEICNDSVCFFCSVLGAAGVAGVVGVQGVAGVVGVPRVGVAGVLRVPAMTGVSGAGVSGVEGVAFPLEAVLGWRILSAAGRRRRRSTAFAHALPVVVVPVAVTVRPGKPTGVFLVFCTALAGVAVAVAFADPRRMKQYKTHNPDRLIHTTRIDTAAATSSTGSVTP